MVLSGIEPVGGFIGSSASEPLLQRAINRRVEARVLTTRELSSGLLGPSGHRKRHVVQVFRLQMGIYRRKFSMNFLMNFTHHAGVAAALGIGGWYAVTGRVEVGTVVAFISGLAKVNDPWEVLVNWSRDLTVNVVKYRPLSGALERLRGVRTSD